MNTLICKSAMGLRSEEVKERRSKEVKSKIISHCGLDSQFLVKEVNS